MSRRLTIRVCHLTESRVFALLAILICQKAPHGGWVSDWSESYRKASLLVSNMTIAEKTNLTAGTGIFMGRCVGNSGSALRVHIPQLCLQDGPLGVRNTDHNTAFPAGITVGATWDKDLMYQRGVAIGEEFRGKGVNIHLGPSVGPLGRKPRGGRSKQLSELVAKQQSANDVLRLGRLWLGSCSPGLRGSTVYRRHSEHWRHRHYQAFDCERAGAIPNVQPRQAWHLIKP